jgi:SAM-dependent methyltransferase
MTTNYDPIAERYQRSKRQPWRTHIEAYSLMTLGGGLDGKAALDVACGEGFHTRLLRQRGAERVIGAGLSPGMIALARSQESLEPLGIDYVVRDGKALSFDEPFDLVFAAYFLNYAHDAQELQSMCVSLARCLKPGGRLVSVNCGPFADFTLEGSYRKYGFDSQVSRPLRNGAPILWTFFLEDGDAFRVENYFLDQPKYEAAFRAAGFREIRWPALRLSPEGSADFGSPFWADFLQRPPIALIECVRSPRFPRSPPRRLTGASPRNPRRATCVRPPASANEERPNASDIARSRSRASA